MTEQNRAFDENKVECGAAQPATGPKIESDPATMPTAMSGTASGMASGMASGTAAGTMPDTTSGAVSGTMSTSVFEAKPEPAYEPVPEPKPAPRPESKLIFRSDPGTEVEPERKKKPLWIIPIVLIAAMIIIAFVFGKNRVDVLKESDFPQTIEELRALGDRYYDGEVEVKRNHWNDKANALKCYQRAADMGDADAQYLTGYMYNTGYRDSVKQDKKKAQKYFQLAAEQYEEKAILTGDADAQFKIGYMYEYGEGVEKSKKTAVEYYQLAVDQGNVHAQNELGIMYDYGWGVEADHDTATVYYQLAADQGYYRAQENLKAPSNTRYPETLWSLLRP